MKWLFLMCLLISCSDYDADYSVDREEEEDFPQPLPFYSFSTRLNNNLLVSGRVCLGTEMADFEGRAYLCRAGLWLVVVDNINNCTPEGCTDIVVQPTISGIFSFGGDQTTSFYSFLLSIPASGATENVLEDVLLRVDSTGIPTVVYK